MKNRATVGQFADNIYALVGPGTVARELSTTMRRAWGKETRTPDQCATARKRLKQFLHNLKEELPRYNLYLWGPIDPSHFLHWLCVTPQGQLIYKFKRRFLKDQGIEDVEVLLPRAIRSAWQIEEPDLTGPFIMPTRGNEGE